MRWAPLLLSLAALAGCERSPSKGPIAPSRESTEPVPPRIAAQLQAPERRRTQETPSTPQPRRARPGEFPTIHGRVEDARTGRGVPDAEVTLALAPGLTQKVRTDALGSFEAEPEWPPNQVRVSVRPPRGWRVVRSASGSLYPLLDASEIRGTEPVVIEVLEQRRGSVRGVAVDEATGEALPQLAFAVRPAPDMRTFRGSPLIEVTTNERGEFELSDVRGGEAEILWRDRGPTPAVQRHELQFPEATAGDWRLAFHVGPSFDVTLVGAVPDSLDDLWFAVVTDDGVQGNARSPLHRRDDGSLWIRTHPARHADHRPHFYVIGNDSGTRLAVRRPHETGDAPGRPLEFELEATGAIDVQVDPEVEPNQERHLWTRPTPSVAFEARTSLDAPLMEWRERARRFLPPGDYTVTAWTREHARAATRVVLPAGETVQARLAPRLVAESRRVVGRLHAAHPGELSGCSLMLSLDLLRGRIWSVTDSRGMFCGTGLDHTFDFAPDGRSATFAIERVPLGPLSISVSPSDRPVRVTRREDTDGNIELDLVEFEPERGFGFRFPEQGAKNGPGLGHLSLRTRVHDDGPGFPWRAFEDLLIGEGDPQERRFEWSLAREGNFRTVFGDQNAFVRVTDDRWLADVVFEPGWRARMEVFEASGEPAAGLDVHADGVLLGVTDTDGRFTLELDARPSKVHVARRGGALRPVPIEVATSWLRVVLR